MSKKSAIVLISGGMDSCVVTAIAHLGFELYALHVNYGQCTEGRELVAFNHIAEYYSISEKRRLVADISYLKRIGGSGLTDHCIEIDCVSSTINDEVPNTYVPFRNTHLLSIAVSWAEVVSATTIFIGAVAADTPGYPDCSLKYYDAFNKLADIGTKPSTRIEVTTPVISMQKYEIVKRGMELNAPLHMTWSCYKNSTIACGKCNSCVLRLNAFKGAGVSDPVNYAHS